MRKFYLRLLLDPTLLTAAAAAPLLLRARALTRFARLFLLALLFPWAGYIPVDISSKSPLLVHATKQSSTLRTLSLGDVSNEYLRLLCT